MPSQPYLTWLRYFELRYVYTFTSKKERILIISRVVQSYIVEYGLVRSSTVEYGTVQYGTVRYGSVQYGTVRVRYGTVQILVRYEYGTSTELVRY